MKFLIEVDLDNEDGASIGNAITLAGVMAEKLLEKVDYAGNPPELMKKHPRDDALVLSEALSVETGGIVCRATISRETFITAKMRKSEESGQSTEVGIRMRRYG